MTKDGLVKYHLIKGTFYPIHLLWFQIASFDSLCKHRYVSHFDVWRLDFNSQAKEKTVFRYARMLNNYTCRNVIPTEWVSGTCYSVLSLTVSVAAIYRSATRPTTALWLMSYATPSRRLPNPLRLFRPWFS